MPSDRELETLFDESVSAAKEWYEGAIEQFYEIRRLCLAIAVKPHKQAAYQQEVRTVGHSLMVIVPKKIKDVLRLQPGDRVRLLIIKQKEDNGSKG